MSSVALIPGAQIGPFRILKLLGEGGVGRVYAALDVDLGRPVALKALRPEVSHDASFVERFRGEAASLARLQHPNITTLYSLHRDNRDLYMVMELVRGFTLEEVLQREKRLPIDAVRALAAQACAGLAYAHRMGVIHRDIKPSNLMLTESGLLKIMDFGIARVRGSQRMTRAGSIVGTLAYMPPEQIKGADNDERSDIYSLACVFYELLCGQPPFAAETEYDLIQAQIGQTPSPLKDQLKDLETSVEDALARALQKSPSARFADAGSFARALGSQTLSGDPDDVLRAGVMAHMPRLQALDMQAMSLGKPAGPTGPAVPPVGGQRRKLAAPAWLPVAVLGGAAALAAGVLGFMMLAAGGSALPQRTVPIAAEEGDTQAAISSETPPVSLPVNPNILPAPDAQASSNEKLAAAGQARCSSGDESGFVESHVDSVSDQGWPQISGEEVHLFGVRDLAPSTQSRLANWLSKKGGTIDCCAMGNVQLCHTAGAHHQDLALYLLLNGLAHADGGAPEAYLQAEETAKSARRGLWQ